MDYPEFEKKAIEHSVKLTKKLIETVDGDSPIDNNN